MTCEGARGKRGEEDYALMRVRFIVALWPRCSTVSRFWTFDAELVTFGDRIMETSTLLPTRSNVSVRYEQMLLSPGLSVQHENHCTKAKGCFFCLLGCFRNSIIDYFESFWPVYVWVKFHSLCHIDSMEAQFSEALTARWGWNHSEPLVSTNQITFNRAACWSRCLNMWDQSSCWPCSLCRCQRRSQNPRTKIATRQNRPLLQYVQSRNEKHLNELLV